jgi:hypothetical protein
VGPACQAQSDCVCAVKAARLSPRQNRARPRRCIQVAYSTTPSAPLVDSPHHITHTGAVLLTSRNLRRRAVSVRSFSVVHSLISGVLASPSAPAAALPPATSNQQPPYTIAAIRPRCTQNLVPPRVLYAPRPRPCNLRADHCLSLVQILGRLVPRQRLSRLTAAVPSTRSRRATLISQCPPHHG